MNSTGASFCRKAIFFAFDFKEPEDSISFSILCTSSVGGTKAHTGDAELRACSKLIQCLQQETAVSASLTSLAIVVISLTKLGACKCSNSRREVNSCWLIHFFVVNIFSCVRVVLLLMYIRSWKLVLKENKYSNFSAVRMILNLSQQ